MGLRTVPAGGQRHGRDDRCGSRLLPNPAWRPRDRRDSPIFNTFRDNEVNGRPGVQLTTRGDEQCAQVLTAGSGGLVANVSDSSGVSDPVDECAEALRIMTMIEPKLPEAGS